ncbi:MAG: DUF4065 domain-containing protein [Proteobacteria bacterium]|nr:DUF4065 domain-containing protein [Pseudomonadota bacterium]
MPDIADLPAKDFANPITPIAAANYLLEKRDALKPIKLIKLVYLCHGYCLAYFGKPLVDEKPQAWRYGPVFPSLYYAVQDYGNNPVVHKINEGLNKDSAPPNYAQQQFMDAIYEDFKEDSDDTLSGMASYPDSPWAKVRKKAKGNAPIGDKDMRMGFVEFVDA